METALPEPGQQAPVGGFVDGWRLRTKVAVVLMVPALIALVLSANRVQSRLDEASRLSAVRDQLTVVRSAITLAGLVANEMSAAVAAPQNGTPTLGQRMAEVDTAVAGIQHAADFTTLPADAVRTLGDALGRLSAIRPQVSGTDATPAVTTAGYSHVMSGLGELVPQVVSLAGDRDLDRSAASLRSLMLLRGALATEDALLRSGQNGAVDNATAVAAQNAAADEAVIGGLLGRDIPDANATALGNLTQSAPARRDALQTAIGTGTTDLRGLLPAITTELAALDGLASQLLGSLSDSVAERTRQARSDALRDTAIVLGALLAALAVALVVARSLLGPVRRLRAAALTAARHQLPATVERVRAGERVDWRSIEPVPVHTGEEIGQLARAFDDMHQQAVRLAGEQAELRRQVSEMFMTLSRRSQSLVELQLGLIEGLEADEQDPQRLDDLFRLDHLATRLRRNGENLQVLAGGSPARRNQGAISTVELLRAATSEVKDYQRVNLGHAPSGSIDATIAADVVHILAELLENATRYSPPERQVVLTADRASDGGLLVEVIDTGLGMAPDDLAAANTRLAATNAVGPETTRRMGLFVISRLATRHGVTVRLRATHDTATRAGITASVHLPGALVIAERAPQPPLAPPRPAAPPPPPAQPVPAMRTPIFDNLVSNWFNDGLDHDSGTDGWLTPADEQWRAAQAVVDQEPAITATTNGLPRRTPGARVVPSRPDLTQGTTAPGAGWRDAESVRNTLARHYNGVREARERNRGTADTPDPAARRPRTSP